jgi:hypothetical protein
MATRGDVLGIAMWGLAGLVASSTYKGASLWLEKRNSRCDLHPATNGLCEDVALYSLFCGLQKHRGLDEAAFRRAVDCSDRLVYLDLQLSNGNATASVDDGPLAFSHFKAAEGHLERLLDRAKKESAEVEVCVHTAYAQIYDALKKHLLNVMKLSKNA